jgi:methyltransferase (TIGR00027 family)
MIAARPSRTAWRVALRRAAHQLLDRPLVLEDPIALRILGAEPAAALKADPGRFETGPLSSHLRAFVAARSRFAEDRLLAARRAGVGQYVVLGAGLDTFAYRDPEPSLPLRVWEVDHPATQAWKRQLLENASIATPGSLTFVPVDFEHDTLAAALSGAGFDPAAGAVFSWLGVVPYLSLTAIRTTLSYVASVAGAGGIAFDYGLSPDGLAPDRRALFDAMAARVSAAGEPWRTFFAPGDLERDLRGLGFAEVCDLGGEEINARYFARRQDRLAVGSLGRLVWAGASLDSGGSATIRDPEPLG